uniref:Putative secreted protein n=1 Tax=Anopheles darlingi TaxID=43151 RepID=A0A2M4DH23_ANODA
MERFVWNTCCVSPPLAPAWCLTWFLNLFPMTAGTFGQQVFCEAPFVLWFRLKCFQVFWSRRYRIESLLLKLSETRICRDIPLLNGIKNDMRERVCVFAFAFRHYLTKIDRILGVFLWPHAHTPSHARSDIGHQKGRHCQDQR